PRDERFRLQDLIWHATIVSDWILLSSCCSLTTRSPAMIRMPVDDRHGAIQLLGHDQPHQHVREREGPQRPALVGALQYVARVAVGAAYQEREIAAGHAPFRQLIGELFARPR